MSDQHPDEKARATRDTMAMYATVTQVGFEMVGPMVLGIALDYWLRTLPWLTLGGVFLGFAGAMTHLVLIANRTPPDSPSGSPSSGKGVP